MADHRFRVTLSSAVCNSPRKKSSSAIGATTTAPDYRVRTTIIGCASSLSAWIVGCIGNENSGATS